MMHALLFLALVPSAPAPPDVPKELQKFQGIWKVTATERGGTTSPTPPAALTDRMTLVVVGDAYVFSTHAGTVKIDVDKKTVDLTITEGRYKGMTLPGQLELSDKDNTLKLAIPSPTPTGRRGGPVAPAAPERPKTIKSEEGTTYMVYTFQRDAKATKEQAATKLKELKDSLTSPVTFGPANSRTTEDMLRQIIERLDRIEKRLDEMEKKQGKSEK
jgi:uncharacterized protein (TIGR03067 family)